MKDKAKFFGCKERELFWLDLNGGFIDARHAIYDFSYQNKFPMGMRNAISFFFLRDHTPNKNATPEEKGMQGGEGNYVCVSSAIEPLAVNKSQRYSIFPSEI